MVECPECGSEMTCYCGICNWPDDECICEDADNEYHYENEYFKCPKCGYRE